jgi:ATP-dependent DNA ligase
MLAKLTREFPEEPGWSFEPKWDGFRSIVFYDGAELFIQSRDLKPLGRYFPELERGLREALPGPAVLDGEIVIMTDHGLDFDALQLRIHPAESRIRMLAEAKPASFVAFDLLAQGHDNLCARPYAERRARLERYAAPLPSPVHLTPVTRDLNEARDWFDRFEGAGLDGLIAKPDDSTYQPGVRAMIKLKHLRTVDCVVGGFRWNRGEEGKSVGSLLLGLYDEQGILHHVGHTSSFDAATKRKLAEDLEQWRTGDESLGFGQGRTPGAESRWSRGRGLEQWERLRPELVCEVTFDHLQGARFRHASTFQRWRFDKAPTECTFDQLEATVPYELKAIFGRPE